MQADILIASFAVCTKRGVGSSSVSGGSDDDEEKRSWILPRGRQGFSGESDSPTTKCHSMNEVSTSKDDGETSAFRLAISQKRCYRGSRGKHSM
uniref:Uncharacterized protein n=1 Tax=Vespula pensylvanica TaxID=30213 RepID=A0A834U7R2_VESPE|nr:hypothetical protein H0235_010483 [Vespula pensylvanica]